MHGKDYTIRELIEMGPKSYDERLEPVSDSPGDYWQSPKIDPEIYSLIAELNDSGYETLGSCAGHSGAKTRKGKISSGYVTFPLDLSEGEIEDIKSIFRKHGINAKVRDTKEKFTLSSGESVQSNFILFEFPAIGSSHRQS